VVLEGNRRLTALKLLEIPTLVPADLPDSLAKGFRELSARYSPPATVSCAVVADRQEAQHWLELRHTGENDGVGVVQWGATEKARFSDQVGKRFFALQAVDFLRNLGGLSPAEVKSLSQTPITTLQRLLADPDVRKTLGLSLTKGTLVTHLPAAEVAKGLRRATLDMAEGRINVNDIRSKTDRAAYLGSFKANDLPTASSATGPALPLAAAPGPAAPPAGAGAAQAPAKSGSTRLQPHVRKTLVPKSCKIAIGQPRLNAIFHEMRKLNPDEFPNASAILLRVFLELSVDEYLDAKKLGKTPNDKLKEKVRAVVGHMQGQSGVTKLDLAPVHAALTPDQLFSIVNLHAFIHNAKFHPSANDLLRLWDQMQRFAELLWTP
jgi:hypothetical protein